jgi:hypothetical protein
MMHLQASELLDIAYKHLIVKSLRKLLGEKMGSVRLARDLIPRDSYSFFPDCLLPSVWLGCQYVGGVAVRISVL